MIAQNHERTITPDNQSEDAGHDIEYAPLALHVDFAQILEIEMRVAGHKLPPAENAIIEFLLDKQQFIRHFVIGPSFAEGMRLSLQSRLVASPGLLIEGFLACSGELGRKCGQLDLEDHVSMSRCSKAVQKLRSRNLRDLSEAPGVLALGTSILTYDHLALMNTGPLICRYTLSQIEPWYLQLSRMPEMDFELNCLVYLDIFHCLLHREIPVLRPKIRDSKVVDRYIGVCYTLLPLLYDICNVASKLKGTNSIEEVDTISRLHVLVANWQPTLPDDFASRYTTYEVVAMISQANIYRQVALLILHRLRYKFGNEDLAAKSYSESILSEIKTCHRICGQYPFKVGVSLLIAAFEATGSDSRHGFLSMLFEVGGILYRQRNDMMKDLLRYLWCERDAKEGVSWFEIISMMPKLSFIP